MAEQTFNVNCGFFDSIDKDRLYSANEMNRPYKRIITNGVFATPKGTPSTDLQVVSAGNGMNIIVNPGEGLFADKWFENPAVIAITVPNNPNIVPRRDSVIVQVDNRQSGRVGNIVYREGTPSSNPQAPAINTVTDVVEYRIANIYVAPGANAINNDAIVDLRGSNSCPWITSLIQQVDTSTLWNQWQAAYQSYYDKMTVDFNNWFKDLTEELTVETNVMALTSMYKTTASTKTIPINIPNYNSTTDILMVYINGLKVNPNTDYTITSNSNITLTKAVASGQIISFLVLKTVLTSDMATTLEAVEEANQSVQQATNAVNVANATVEALTNKYNKITQDSGWINFTLESGASAYDNSNKPGVRCIGDRVYLRGAFKGVTTKGSIICTLPTAYRPSQNHVFTTCAVNSSGTINDTIVMQVKTNGSIVLLGSSGAITATDMISMATDFVLN